MRAAQRRVRTGSPPPDIIPRTHTQPDLDKSQAHLAGIIASAMDAIITIDAHQHIILFNPAAEAIFGCSAERARGQPLEQFIPERFRAAHHEFVREFERSGATHRTMGSPKEVLSLRANGQEFPAEASISRLEADGHVLMTVILRDVSERKRAEQALRQAHAELEQRVAERTAALGEANQDLSAEIAERQNIQDALERAKQELEARVAARTRELQLSNEQLVLELEQRRRVEDRFAALYKTARDLADVRELDQVLDTVAESALRLLEAPRCRIYLYNPARTDLEVVIQKGFASENGLRPKVGEGIAWRSAVTRQPLIVENDPGEDPRESDGTPPVPNLVLAVPMLYRGELVGVIALSAVGEPKRTFTQTDLRLLELLAAQAASTIHSATLLDQVRAGRQRLQLLSAQLLTAQENERRALARELHDEIGQVLTAVKTNLQGLHLLTRSRRLQASLDESMGTIDHALQQVRDLSLDLRPSILDDFGLVAALEWYVERLARRSGLPMEIKAHPLQARLQADFETAAFRVAQEALTNVLRHSRAKQASVEIMQRGAELQLKITDDGVGFEVQAAREKAARGASIGLLGMEERVLLLGGKVEIDSAPGQGTVICARFPFKSRRLIERRRRRRI